MMSAALVEHDDHPAGARPTTYEPMTTAPSPEPAATSAPATDIEGRPYASWVRRVIAFVIDVVLVGLVFVILDLVVSGDARTAAAAVGLVVQVLYFTLLNGSAEGQTLGKMAMHITVRDQDTGGPVGPRRAFSPPWSSTS